MSWSYRKTPICGMTIAASDKAFKKTEHNRCQEQAIILRFVCCAGASAQQFGKHRRSLRGARTGRVADLPAVRCRCAIYAAPAQSSEGMAESGLSLRCVM